MKIIKTFDKLAIVFLLATSFLFFITGKVYAESDFKYKINEDGKTVTITKYMGKETDVVVPNEIDGYIVTTIGNVAFYYNANIKSVTLPQTVKDIQQSAFGACSNLVSINIPLNTETIGEQAFKGCKSLVSIYIPANVSKIGYYTFGGCESLSAFNVSVDNKKFSSDDGILYNKKQTELLCFPMNKLSNEFKIKDTVETIGKYAFAFNKKILKIIIPNSVKTIDTYAFYACEGLTNIDIPKNVYSLKRMSFAYCKNLKKVTVYGEKTFLDDEAFTASKSVEILCKPDSNAEAFARKNNVTYKYIDDFIKGDINGDKKITATDMLIMKKKLIGISMVKENEINVLDLNGDKKFSISDLLIMKRIIIGIKN